MSGLADYVAEAVERGFSNEEITLALQKKGYTKSEIAQAMQAFMPSSLGTRVSQTSSTISLKPLDKIKLLFSHPNVFFSSVREPTLKYAFLLYLVVGLLSVVVQVGVSYGFFGILSGGSYSIFSLSSLSFYLAPVFFIFSLGLTFVYAGIAHLVIRGFKGVGGYISTYNACTYSLVPFLMLSIIPLVGWLSFIYSLVLMVFGLSAYHGISKGKAVFAVLLPVIITLVLLGLFIFYILFSLRGLW